MLAVIISFIGGFLLANALNRSELNVLRVENERLKSAPPTNSDADSATLSDEEIRQRIAEADQNPDNLEFQKNLGIGLYRYATVKQNPALFVDVERLLERVYKKDPKDYDSLVVYGHTLFDIGYAKKDNEKFAQARKIYTEALVLRPKDADIQTDLGLTYFYLDPPEYEKATAELNKTLVLSPNHEHTLQYMTELYALQNKKEEARKYI